MMALNCDEATINEVDKNTHSMTVVGMESSIGGGEEEDEEAKSLSSSVSKLDPSSVSFPGSEA